MTPGERRAEAMKVLAGCTISRPQKHFMFSKVVLPFSRDRRHVSGAVWSQCLKKKAYDSRRDAERVASRIYQERGEALRVYPCHHCGKYHLSKHFRHYNDDFRFG